MVTTEADIKRVVATKDYFQGDALIDKQFGFTTDTHEFVARLGDKYYFSGDSVGSVTGDYLPLSGGIMTGTIVTDFWAGDTSPTIDFKNNLEIRGSGSVSIAGGGPRDTMGSTWGTSLSMNRSGLFLGGGGWGDDSAGGGLNIDTYGISLGGGRSNAWGGNLGINSGSLYFSGSGDGWSGGLNMSSSGWYIDGGQWGSLYFNTDKLGFFGAGNPNVLYIDAHGVNINGRGSPIDIYSYDRVYFGSNTGVEFGAPNVLFNTGPIRHGNLTSVYHWEGDEIHNTIQYNRYTGDVDVGSMRIVFSPGSAKLEMFDGTDWVSAQWS